MRYALFSVAIILRDPTINEIQGSKVKFLQEQKLLDVWVLLIFKPVALGFCVLFLDPQHKLLGNFKAGGNFFSRNLNRKRCGRVIGGEKTWINPKMLDWAL